MKTLMAQRTSTPIMLISTSAMKNSMIMLCLLLAATACNSNRPTAKTRADTKAKKAAGIQYTCTMHPDVITGKPGTCPKCGMELVEKDNNK